MKQNIGKYVIIISLLLTYANRGLFVSAAYESEMSKEINSVIELFIQLINGEGNDIDEDGDMQTHCGFTPLSLFDFSQPLVQANFYLEDSNPIGFPHKENIPYKDFYCQIDHPPERI